MAIRMQQRRGTADQWTLANPVLGTGEIGFETNTNKFKIGDGVNTWANLDYFLDETALSGSLSDYVETALLGEADGVATLDGSGKLLSSQIPSDLATQTYVDTAVSNLVDMAPAALDTLNELAAALGDDSSFATTVTNSLATKSDIGHTHLLADVTDITATVQELNYVDGVTSNIQTQIDDKADLEHTHAISDVTNLQTALDEKASTNHTHTFSNITDTQISSPTSGQALVYNGTKWINQNAASSDPMPQIFMLMGA